MHKVIVHGILNRKKKGEASLFYIVTIALACLGFTLAACTRSLAKEVFSTPTTAAPQITIESAQVIQSEGIYITGRTTLANSECIQTSLLANGKAAAWWPGDVCIQVDAGGWEMLASLGKNGAPAQLDANTTYMLQAWWPKQKQATLTQFPLSDNGPKKP